MKALKIILKTVGVIVALLVVALLALPLWFGPVARGVANSVVPGVVKTDFHLGHIYLNPYTARFELGDMQLSNPKGYSETYAATLGSVVFDAETASLMSDVIHIEEITVKGVFVSLVKGGENNVGNFKQIQYNVAGGKEKYEAEQAAKSQQQEAQEEQPAQKPAADTGKKVIIDKLHISGLKLQLGPMPISVPVTIELTDIGKDKGGATLEEAWQSIYESVLKAAGIVGEQLKMLGELTGDFALKATEALGDASAAATMAATQVASQATEAVGNVAGQTKESVDKAAAAVTDTAANVTKTAGDVVGAAASAVSDTAAGTTKAVGDAASKAAEGATKALDSLKKLW